MKRETETPTAPALNKPDVGRIVLYNDGISLVPAIVTKQHTPDEGEDLNHAHIIVLGGNFSGELLDTKATFSREGTASGMWQWPGNV